MNLRILKKLSKRAAPLLPLLGDTRKQFRATPFANYGVSFIPDRKHWERSYCHPNYEPRSDWVTPRRQRGHEIKFTTRAGRSMVMRPPSHPRRGTIMVGGVSGYYEPEWDETSAWCSLVDMVHCHFTDWRPENPVLLRSLNTVTEIFAAAHDMAEELRDGR